MRIYLSFVLYLSPIYLKKFKTVSYILEIYSYSGQRVVHGVYQTYMSISDIFHLFIVSESRFLFLFLLYSMRSDCYLC